MKAKRKLFPLPDGRWGVRIPVKRHHRIRMVVIIKDSRREALNLLQRRAA